MDEKIERFNSRFYEISNKKSKGGKREILLVLHEIMPDETVYQDNGISWKEEFVLKAIDSLKGAPLAVEFINDKKDAIWGHGMTDEIDTDDGKMPIFENSEVVGSFIEGYISDVEIDGVVKHVLMGRAYIYEQRYKNFVDWLVINIPLGNVMGSVEINGLPENKNVIVYENGFKETGRVPMVYCYSGHALLSNCVKPADKSAIVLEINEDIKNQNKEAKLMDEKILAQFVDSVKSTIVEINSKNSEFETKVAELNSIIAAKDGQVAELNASVEQLTTALEAVKKEKQELWDKEDVLYKEMEVLKAEIAKAKVKERVGELNSALSAFSDEEKSYAKDEIDAFNADPMTSEINSIVNKIYSEIGKKEKEKTVSSEQNSANSNGVDIFAEVYEDNKADTDNSIF